MEAIWLVAAVGVPLAFNPWGGSAFELPKALLLRALALLAVPAMLLYVWKRNERSSSGLFGSRAAMYLLPILAWTVALVLATVFSVNPRVSLWGAYERQQGLLTRLAYLALFLLVALGLRTWAQAERLLTALIWSSAPVVGYGLLQAVGVDPLGWQTSGASPVLSTLGRANFLGAYLVLVAPLTWGRLLMEDRRRWAYAVLLVSQVTCLALTQARGAMVGLGAATLAFGLIWAFVRRDYRWALAALALLTLAVGFVVLLNWDGGPFAALARLPGLERWAALGRIDGGSLAARRTIWRATLPLIGDRPWLGYGPETMRPVFARVFPPRLVYYQGRSASIDRAHNLWLDLAMSSGVVGVAAFGALLVGWGWRAWRGLTRASADRERVVWAALMAAVAGHLVDLQVGFALTGSATVFWLVLALGAALSRGLVASVATAARALKPLDLLPYLAPVVAALALIGVFCLRPLLADVAAWRVHQSERPLAERLALGEQATQRWPWEPAYRLQLARLYQEAGKLKRAEVQLSIADHLSPDDPRIWSARGALYAAWGRISPARYRQAEAAYRRALALAPHTASYHAALGLVLARQRRLEAGVAALERAVALDATNAAAFDQLARLYRTLGNDQQAEWAHAEAVRWGVQK
jgi:putative inorganic carbon (HCO3(-)) transporter